MSNDTHDKNPDTRLSNREIPGNRNPAEVPLIDAR